MPTPRNAIARLSAVSAVEGSVRAELGASQGTYELAITADERDLSVRDLAAYLQLGLLLQALEDLPA